MTWTNDKEPILLMTTPERILPDGIDETVVINPFNGKQCKARKGTVATTIMNIARLNELLDKDLHSAEETNEINAICQTQKRLNQSLGAVAIFDLLNLSEWLNTDKMPGRVYIAMLFLEDNPLEVTSEITNLLQSIALTTKSRLVNELASKLVATS